MDEKVCMVVSNPFTNDSRVNKEASSLAKSGYEVVVYATSSPNHKSEETLDSVLIKRLDVFEYSLFRLNMFRAPFDFFPSLVKLIREKANIYHAHDLDTLFICFLAAFFNKSKLIYDSHELFLEMQQSEFAGVWWKSLAGKFLIPIWRIVEKFCAQRADYVITVNESIKQILLKRLGVKRIEVLMNCAPASAVKRGRKFHEEFSLPGDAKVVLYQGGIMWRRALKQLVDAVEYFPEDTYLILMGDGTDKKDLMSYASSKVFKDRIEFMDKVSLEVLPTYTASADLGVVSLLNTSLNNYYGLPNKLFEYMAAVVPVVASDFPEIRKIVIGEGVGACFNPEDPRDIARAIEQVLSDKSKLNKMRENTRRAAKEKYNWEIEEKKLLKLYRNL